MFDDYNYNISNIENIIQKLRLLRVFFLEKQIIITKRFMIFCLMQNYKMFFNKFDNLSRYFKQTTNDAHKHIASIMKKKYCQKCRKILRRQCDFERHMRNIHFKVDFTS